ncbi:MAG: tyrosine-type recombinase/integrase, partial [Oscillospiraceae bacterium]
IAVDMGRNKPKEIREDLELVNLKSNGELLTPDSEKFLGRISRKELSVNFKFHNLRHTHASWLAEHNVPAIVAKKRLGHSKEETTLKYYQHITQGMRSDLLEKLNGTAV